MKNLTYSLSNGNIIELSVQDMFEIKEYYIVQNMADYLRENNEDWSEDKVQFVAQETMEELFDLDTSEDERIAIESAEEKWESDINE